jgi:hypothetical protein
MEPTDARVNYLTPAGVIAAFLDADLVVVEQGHYYTASLVLTI